MLSHDDRSRILSGQGPVAPFPRGRWIGTLLFDGFYRANWKVTEENSVATLIIDRFSRLPADASDAVDEITAEGTRLLTFVAPDADDHRVQFVPSP